MKHHLTAQTIAMILAKLPDRSLVLSDTQEGETTYIATPIPQYGNDRVWLCLDGQVLSYHPDRKFWVA